jgi:aryl-alcohol dehydrogenase-like predicted oxidoreductase
MPRLVIGTAQWGLDYGVTNQAGQLSDSAIEQLLAGMNEFQIHDLDTAAAYGNAESRIAKFAPPNIRIHTKVSGKDPGNTAIIQRINESLNALERDSLDGVLIHDWYALAAEERESAVLQLEQAQADSLTQKIGISIYALEELTPANQLFNGTFTAQIPINIVDQRFLTAHESFPSIEFQARSIFLQGLLLQRTGEFKEHADLLQVEQFSQDNGLSPLDTNLIFISQQEWLDSVILAPTSITELQELCQAWDNSRSNPLSLDFDQLKSRDTRLIDPRTWTRVPGVSR